MKSIWRWLVALGAAAALSGTLTPAATAAPGPAPVPVEVPLGSQAPDGDAGAAPDDEVPVVHSWALAPAGSEDSPESGNRPTLSYDLAPGSEVTDQVTLFNYSNVQLTFQLYATDAFNNEDGQFDLLPSEEAPTDVGTWVTLPQGAVTLGPRSQASFPVTIRVPSDARPGDHAGALLASSQAMGTGPDGKVVALDRRTGSRIYVRVDGPLAPELTVEDLRSSYRPALNPLDGTTTVSYRVHNRGNVRLGGRHRVVVSAPFGLLARRAPVQEVTELLPGESVEVEVVLDGVVATGLVVAEVELEPFPVEGEVGDLAGSDRRARAFAPPLTVIAVLLAVALALYARRSYLRRQADQPPPGGGDGDGGGDPGRGGSEGVASIEEERTPAETLA